jgi:hypothetical protein
MVVYHDVLPFVWGDVKHKQLEVVQIKSFMLK